MRVCISALALSCFFFSIRVRFLKRNERFLCAFVGIIPFHVTLLEKKKEKMNWLGWLGSIELKAPAVWPPTLGLRVHALPSLCTTTSCLTRQG